MTILDPDKLGKFRDRLYRRKVVKLFQDGARGLAPLKKYKKDDKGRTLVFTKDITRYFLKEVTASGTPFPDEYFAALFSLFETMSQGSEPVSFDCGFSVSQEDIQAADNKTTIELLTTNIIITYFNNLKTYKGAVDKTLLAPNLKALIEKSNAGRDYKSLVSNTLTGLTRSIAEDKPWRDYLEDLNDADLICRLAGARLPSMEKEVMARIIGKSRREVLGLNDLLTKLLNTRSQLTAEEANQKKFLKTMEKLNTATIGTLKKIDAYLGAAHRLIRILNLSAQTVMGRTDGQLKSNLVRLFMGAGSVRDDQPYPADIVSRLGVAGIRYRLNMLFSFPELTVYAGTLKTDDAYTPLFISLFKLLYEDMARKLEGAAAEAGEGELKPIGRNLRELIRAVDRLGLEGGHLTDEKQRIRNAYTDLAGRVDYTTLPWVVEMGEAVCRATQDRTRETMAALREALITASFSSLRRYAEKSLPADRAKYGIKKRLNAYAMHYKPQREFYRIFFERYVATDSPSPHLVRIMAENKLFAAALLMIFSDEKSMADLIPEHQISRSQALLAELRQTAAQ